MDSPGESHSSNGVGNDHNRGNTPDLPHPEGRVQETRGSRPSSDRDPDVPDSQSQVLQQRQNTVSRPPPPCARFSEIDGALGQDLSDGSSEFSTRASVNSPALQHSGSGGGLVRVTPYSPVYHH